MILKCVCFRMSCSFGTPGFSGALVSDKKSQFITLGAEGEKFSMPSTKISDFKKAKILRNYFSLWKVPLC